MGLERCGTRAVDPDVRPEGSQFDCPEGARFTQPRTTPWENGLHAHISRPNGPTVRRNGWTMGVRWGIMGTVGPLGR